MTDENTIWFAKVTPSDAASGVIDAGDDERVRLLAVCVLHQQNAGFKNRIDLRQTKCPECQAPGFNTGWGYWLHACGNELLSDGSLGEHGCSKPDKSKTAEG